MGETSTLGILEKEPEASAEPEVTDTDLVPSQTGLSRRHGLRKLSSDVIAKASDDTSAQVTRIGLTLLGTAAFCLLSLFSPDSALLGGSEKINVPLAGPVSFFGFMLLGPAILVVLRVYLQIYVEHSERLGRVARRMPVIRAPTLVPLKNPLLRRLGGFTFYLLLPLTMLLFTWKAAALPLWGSGLLCVAVGVIAFHALLPFRRLRRLRTLLSLGIAILAGGVLAIRASFGFEPPRRPFDLSRANLSDQWLPLDDLKDANLIFANLSGAKLFGANLSGASLFGANLSRANLLSANLSHANLARANLTDADLSHADLEGAHLDGAHLDGANLSANLRHAYLTGANLSHANLIAIGLTQAQLDQACGKDAKLPPGLSLKPCPTEPAVAPPAKATP